MRCAYGADTVYQNLALEALGEWKKWNEEVKATSPSALPHGLKPSDQLYINNGNLSVSSDSELGDFEIASMKSLAAAGHGGTHYIVRNPRDIEKAINAGFAHAIDPFGRIEKGKPYSGVLDTVGGLLYADKACLYALHKARAAGVTFVFGQAGTFIRTLVDSKGNVTGIATGDGKQHKANLVVIAGGGWTGTLVPELDNLCEATGGSVIAYKLPRDSPLWDRFSPERFPSWGYGIRAGASGGLYGFPRTPEGLIKIGYRGTKYTNPVLQVDGKERSKPTTRYTSEDTLTAIPAAALRVISGFVAENLPELVEHEIPIVLSRVCWYNDSYDNNLVLDFVPGIDGLMVATGGSGHAFKYLPVLGKYMADIIEGKRDAAENAQKEIFSRWRWRSLSDKSKAVNKLGEGSAGNRVLKKQVLIDDKDLNNATTGIIAKL